jgi:transposase-like protein
MSAPLLITVTARALRPGYVAGLSDRRVEALFRQIRWPSTDGAPICPHCGAVAAYETRRPTGLLRFRCKQCVKDFTITSGTIFSSAQVPLRKYLLAIALFCNQEDVSIREGSRLLEMSYSSTLYWAHRLRRALAKELGQSTQNTVKV